MEREKMTQTHQNENELRMQIVEDEEKERKSLRNRLIERKRVV